LNSSPKYRPSSFSILITFILLMIVGLSLLPLLNVQLTPSRSLPGLSVYYSWPDASARVIDDFGPIVIPHKGLAIVLNPLNYLIYQRTIRELEKQKLEEKSVQFYLNDYATTIYTFRHNYYFMMGDNRHNSADSRY
jgi:hypothetical protein